MTNACVYIGGFSGSEKARDRIVNALRTRHEYANVTGFTLSYATNHPKEVASAIKNAQTIVTHSAGILIALRYADESHMIHAIAPPVPRRLHELTFVRSIQTTGWLHRSHHATERAREVGRHNFEAAWEFISHPFANMRHALHISTFDVLNPEINSRLSGTAFMEFDEYFMLGEEFVESVLRNTRNVVVLHGEHDELQLDPESVLEEYFAKHKTKLANRS